jgi:hypothetical protein
LQERYIKQALHVCDWIKLVIIRMLYPHLKNNGPQYQQFWGGDNASGLVA